MNIFKPHHTIRSRHRHTKLHHHYIWSTISPSQNYHTDTAAHIGDETSFDHTTTRPSHDHHTTTRPLTPQARSGGTGGVNAIKPKAPPWRSQQVHAQSSGRCVDECATTLAWVWVRVGTRVWARGLLFPRGWVLDLAFKLSITDS